ncbi:MAG: N-acyl homoserine lactonase family protein [Rhodospirillales bacterium]
MSENAYEIYAIKYGHHGRRRAENFLGGDPHDAPMPLNYYVWAVVGAKHTFIVDTGCDAAWAARRNRNITQPLGEGLKALGIEPASVKDVIVTHLHYDHAGNDGLFPGARYHLQDREMDFATGRCMCHAAMRQAFECSDVQAMVRRLFEGRVSFHDGAAELAPGVSVHHIGGHTKGIQVVRALTRRGWVVLASDTTHFYAHFLDRRVFPIVHNVEGVLEGYDKLEALAASKAHVVPGHDPLVMDIYPPARPNLAGWVARLDADPKELPRR